MEKKYNSNVRKIAPKMRNKRLRETAHGGFTSGGTVIVESGGGGGTPMPDPNSHTHDNKAYLDQISTDINDYLWLRQGHMVNGEVVMQNNKVKAGFADVAATLSENSPVRREFVSRLKDDTVKGGITFEKFVKILGAAIIAGGMQTDGYIAGGMTGKGGAMYDKGGEAVLEVDKILARSTFFVPVMDVLKETFTGGNLNMTRTGGTVYRVEKLKDAYKLYFVAENDGKGVSDMWHNGDMALCKTLNADKGMEAWHRVVTEHGMAETKGKKCVYIVVSDSAQLINVTAEDGAVVNGVMGFDTSLMNTVPAEGDDVVMLGSVTETSRQGMLRLDARGDGFGGIYLLQGIGSVLGTAEQFRATSTPIRITPNGTEIAADSISLKGTDVGEKMAEIEVAADNISLKVNGSGVRNLLRGTKRLKAENLTVLPAGSGCPVRNGDMADVGFTVETNSAHDHVDLVVYRKIKLKPMTRYTLSWMMYGSLGSVMDFYVTNYEGVRICKRTWSCDDAMASESVDGHQGINASTYGKWKKGWITFDTDKFPEGTEAVIIMGRLHKGIADNKAYISAPKLEYGADASQWAPHEDDGEDALLATGIDIKNHNVTVTAENFLVQNENGVPTAMVDGNGKFSAELINAAAVVANALNANTLTVANALIDGLHLTGASKFGPFKIDKNDAIRNAVQTDEIQMMLAVYGAYFRYYDAQGLFKRVDLGVRPSAGASAENGGMIEMLRPTFGAEKVLRGQYIKVRKTTEARRMAGYYDDALYMPSGTVAGLRPRLRSIRAEAAAITVQLSWEDFTVMLFDREGGGGQKINIVLPPVAKIQSGQRVEIRACDAIDNSVTADVEISDTGRVGHNQMKVYVYEGVANKWFVNTF